tara:strand:- start:89 stop:511 length:423 start_codon:yes stop_codon:yes gene_type:complete
VEIQRSIQTKVSKGHQTLLNVTACLKKRERGMEEQPDKMDRILNRLSERLGEWEEWSQIAIENETAFKSYTALSTKTHMDSGCSHAKAQVEVQATPEWASHFKAVAESNLRVEMAKKQMTALDLQFRAEQTKQANLRRVV